MAYNFGTINGPYAASLFTYDPHADGPVFMVNFMRYKEVAVYDDGRETTLSGQEADDLYAPLDVLGRIGADVAFHGEVEGLGEREWHRIGIVRYPTRKSFMDMQSRPDFLERFVHKEAGMEFTIVMTTLATSPLPDELLEAEHLTFVGLPEGAAFESSQPFGVLAVEDVVIGDERRFDRLVVVGGSLELFSLPEGAVVATAVRELDAMVTLVAETIGG